MKTILIITLVTLAVKGIAVIGTIIRTSANAEA